MHIYFAIFLIAFSSLALEITFTRILSVTTWYHLAFFAISTAMLGMTAGAITVYFKSKWFTERLDQKIALSGLGYALVTPLSLVVLSYVPINIGLSLQGSINILLVTLACALPFYFSGIFITTVLTRYPGPIGKLYASDLIGASLGCLLVLVGLEVLSAPSLVLLCSAIGALAGIPLLLKTDTQKLLALSGVLFAVLLSATVFNEYSDQGIRPMVVKGKVENQPFMLERWNSYSRIAVFERVEHPPRLLWGPSPLAPKNKALPVHYMNIDGEAATGVQRFASDADIDHLRYDITNVAYYLRDKGGACIIGVGGGRDVQSALLFGHESVVGIDVNAIFIDLLQNEFRDFAGLANRPEVTLVTDEARSYLSTHPTQYALIQMSLIDTWAATGAGAFSLSENALYTVEAWQTFYQRLKDNGIFTVSRWYDPANLGETGRLLSLAVATLLDMGIEQPAQHIAMLTVERVSTLLFSKQPFSPQDIAKLKAVSAELQYNPAIIPGEPIGNPLLSQIVSATSPQELKQATYNETLNFDAPTDENPYFFNMIRLSYLYPAFQAYKQEVLTAGVISGNLSATLTLVGLLLCLLFLTLVTIVVPLWLKKRDTNENGKIYWSRLLYFCLIGTGFMLIEIGLIQRLSVFLGHPVYALGILLFTIIASAGVGSYLSEKLPINRWVYAYPVIVAATIILVQWFLPGLISTYITYSLTFKAVMSVAILFPLGIMLGFFFPVGMRLLPDRHESETAWYWGLNGVFGVLCSALAVFISIYFGISLNFYLAALCYATLSLCIYGIQQSKYKTV